MSSRADEPPRQDSMKMFHSILLMAAVIAPAVHGAALQQSPQPDYSALLGVGLIAIGLVSKKVMRRN